MSVDHDQQESTAEGTVGGRTVFIPEGKNYKILVASKLTVIRGPDEGRELVVRKEVVTIGRSRSCDLTLSDKAVSSTHAELVTGEQGRVVRDLGSKNGVIFMGHRVGELTLQPRTQFQIGNNMLRFEPLQARHRIPFSQRDHFGQALGRSVSMREIFAVLEKVATSDLPLLLQGETGTGKELLSSAVHMYSFRKNRPFVVLDCGAVSPDTIESTLFGHEKGAFTGAEQRHRGVFEEADGGTLFLDEVAELSLYLQPKLLRVLQQKEIQRVGAVEPIAVDVRIVAATHRDLRAMVEAGSFREDLLYRLSVFEVRIPPLRERIDDIPFLTDHFMEQGNQVRTQLGLLPVQLDDDAVELLIAHPWPGNVRELGNVIERAISLAEGELIGRHELENHLFGGARQPVLPTNLQEPYKQAKARLLERFERQYLMKLMKATGGNLTRAARHAGLVRHHLRELCHRYGIACGAEAPAKNPKPS